MRRTGEYTLRLVSRFLFNVDPEHACLPILEFIGYVEITCWSEV